MTATAFSSPFSANVANDYYYPASSANGIPTAWTNPGSQGIGLPNIYQAINEILNTNYSTNTDVDSYFRDNDSLWLNFESRATVIGYSAYYTNTLGVYNASNASEMYDVLEDQSGQGFAPGYPTALINMSVGPVFGWYLEVTTAPSTTVTYYSESDLNPGGHDHMMTFDLGGPLDFNGISYENPYLIAWEDKAWGTHPDTYSHLNSGYSSWSSYTLGDEDYNDLIFLVDARVVPEPASVLLLGSGLLGLAGLGRKRAKRALKNS